ncbi:siderophore ferric iron reductase [Vogesella indigofera]|uniref:Siderophore ferric iron reductase n=1 Tax=Vogesella indigofera TaxID=45465 RepID=A0ABT5I1E0_VOGIN|nr:siderophore ferric iron reductase [Vogesella indigofera]MDC7689848.1 siderophore ferric iron reductase [Vogesella indigofera]
MSVSHRKVGRSQLATAGTQPRSLPNLLAQLAPADLRCHGVLMNRVCPTLPAVLAQLARILPGLDGQVGAPASSDITVDAANPAPVAALLQHWQQAHPEAGPHYWGSRSWTLLLWQPVYLAVLAVHLAGCLPRLTGMAQRQHGGFVAGFSLPDAGLQHGSEAVLIASAGAQLQALSQPLLELVNQHVKLHPKMAGRLLADCLLAALLHAQRCDAQLGNPRLLALAPQWLAALAQPDASALMTVALDDGRQRLALERKVCCQHFRRCDGELCSTCPKLKPAARLALLKQELSHDAVTA